MMHDFNSVSGMWSDIQLKGRAGQRGGEGTNVEGIEREKEERSVRREEGRGHSSTLSLVEGGGGGLDRARASREERKKGGGWGRGEGWRGGAGVAFVCFPRFKASLEK